MTHPLSELNPRTDTPLDFPDRDFGELTPADYDQLGFMCGLEVHQQLNTVSKLFCRCPAGIRTRDVDAEVLRHMRPTLSELGEYDGTALMEFKTRKEIVYQLERGSVCTYEMDDTPPFHIDEAAVRSAIQVARSLDLSLVSELHVMRKQYLDGSIPAGFQRTTMIGLGGVIPFRDSELGPGRELRIRQLSLEEDSCREVSDWGHRITFRTDRLGMPLTEAVTEPDLLTPLDVAAGGLLLARVARSSGLVRRGAGAARQDVNVSIAGGRRVEIKGVPSLPALPQLVHIEAFRQLNLLRLRAALHGRGVTSEMLALPENGLPWQVSPLAVDARSVLRRCNFAPVLDAIARGDTVAAVRLPGYRKLLLAKTQPGITFAREIAGRVEVIACLTGRPFMIHSDIQDYGLDGSFWQQLRSALKADHDDAMVVLWGPEADVATGIREVLARADDALKGVPAETRQAYPDGTTRFERILPGPDRMYPDTDTPPLAIPDEWVADAEAALAPPVWERDARSHRLWDAGIGALYESLAVPEHLGDRVADSLHRRLVQHRRETGVDAVPDAERLRPLVLAASASNALVAAFDHVLLRLLREADKTADEIVADYTGDANSAATLDELVAGTVSARGDFRGSAEDGGAAMLRWAMGRVMYPLRGLAEPRVAREQLIRKLELELS